MPRLAALLSSLLLLAAARAGSAAAQSVAPVEVSGRLHPADLAPAEGIQVLFRTGERLDSARTGPEGRFSLTVEREPGAEAELIVAADGAEGGYYPARVRLRRGAPTTGMAVVLVPRRWRIYAGGYTGDTVEVDLRAAVAPPCSRCTPFYRGVQGDSLPGPPPGIPNWPDRAFPLRVAFDRARGERVTATDSIAFWRAAEALEGFIGRPLLRAAKLHEVLEPVEEDPRGSVLIFIDPSLRTVGLGSSAAQGGDIMASAVHFRSAGLFSRPDGPGLVQHELVHALGFGHTCAWRSVVADSERCPARAAPTPTPMDVAHVQLLWRIRSLERTLGTSVTIPAALAAMRELFPIRTPPPGLVPVRGGPWPPLPAVRGGL